MQKPSSKKPIIIAVVVIALAIFGYFYFTGSPTDSAGIDENQIVTSDADLVGTRVLTLLNQISSLRIEDSFFKSAVYASLVDHTVPIYEQNVGKTNPFYNPAPAKPKAK